VPDRGLYVHLPFCPYICPYCDFAKWPVARSRAQEYMAALESEIAHAEEFAATTVFLGGGTPNAYEPPVVGALVERLRRNFALPPGAEISVEANPDASLCASFREYREAGVNRLSFGVQSFVEEELRVLGRRHTPDDVAAAVARARTDGLQNI
jgi:oxygen-independent coproporphyrinogen-3 oxidase